MITLKYKQTPFEITLIDLADPPEWFRERSPLGKVPILVVDQDTVLFESAVINEYVDAITPPPLMPADPLDQARTRAWVEYLSEQTFAQYRWMTAATEQDFELAAHTAAQGLERLERQLAGDPLLPTTGFSLIDATLSPVLMRYTRINDPDSPWDPAQFPRLAARWEGLNRLAAVRESVPPDFDRRLADYLAAQQGYAAPRLARTLRAAPPFRDPQEHTDT